MDNHQLQALVEQISSTYFSKPFLHQSYFNPRLKTTGGRYLTKNHNLEFNPKSYSHYGLEELISIIKHELCHYHLHLQKKGYRHRDPDFKHCLSQVGGSRFAKPLSGKGSYRYMLVCLSCKQTYFRKRKMNPDHYRCGKCGGKLILEEN